jgi:CheY-like chemotaxis protein
VADGGEEGLKLAKKLLPDIITLDVMMHKMDGWEVLSHLKADPNLASIPVIMLSMIEEKHIGYSLGASDYLIKPITREKLLKVLQKYHLSFHESARLIMVIDDDVVSRDMVARILRKAGWRVCKVGDGQVALNTIQKKQPDLILLDLQMHEIDAFEFIAKLQENYDSIPIVVLTAKDITAKDRLRLNKVAGIFQKGSYRRDELLAQIYKLNT